MILLKFIGLRPQIIQMKRAIFILSALFFFVSCNQHKEKEAPAVTNEIILPSDSSNIAVVDAHYLWTADWDNSGSMIMKRMSPISTDSLTAENIIGRMNEMYPEVKLQYVKTSNDTIFIKIPKAKYLTQSMGSSGAEGYLAEVTYNLTELNGISNVMLDFAPGDHAEPGSYARTDFIHEKDNSKAK